MAHACTVPYGHETVRVCCAPTRALETPSIGGLLCAVRWRLDPVMAAQRKMLLPNEGPFAPSGGPVTAGRTKHGTPVGCLFRDAHCDPSMSTSRQANFEENRICWAATVSAAFVCVVACQTPGKCLPERRDVSRR